LDSGGKVEIIAQHQFNRSVMVSEEVYKNLSLYESVTGRILLSYCSDEILKEIIEKNNYPEEKWNNVTNWDELQKTISLIRSKEIAVMENKRMEIKAFAVPVLDAENKVLFSLGLTVPLARLNEKAVIKALRETQKSMVEAIAHLNNKK
jgi:DNA-binding IclR family transcriptional regulator